MRKTLNALNKIEINHANHLLILIIYQNQFLVQVFGAQNHSPSNRSSMIISIAWNRFNLLSVTTGSAYLIAPIIPPYRLVGSWFIILLHKNLVKFTGSSVKQTSVSGLDCKQRARGTVPLMLWHKLHGGKGAITRRKTTSFTMRASSRRSIEPDNDRASEFDFYDSSSRQLGAYGQLGAYA